MGKIILDEESKKLLMLAATKGFDKIKINKSHKYIHTHKTIFLNQKIYYKRHLSFLYIPPNFEKILNDGIPLRVS